MKWTIEAEDAIKKVPFFVRKKVRQRVEKEAITDNKEIISIKEVKATQKRYLSGMEAEIKGYRIEACFGTGGCPNRACESNDLFAGLEHMLEQENLLAFLKSNVQGPLKFHHEFSITIADCPNACSQPQIKDIGIIGANIPAISDNECTQCSACVETCKEHAVCLDIQADMPVLDFNKCLLCGQCVFVCPSGTLETAQQGFKIFLGGKLGRHPRLARQLPGIFQEKEVLIIVKSCITFYKKNSKNGQRFAAILKDSDFKKICGDCCDFST